MERIDQHSTDLPGGKEYVIDTFYDDRIFLHPNAKLEITAEANVYRPICAQTHSELTVSGHAAYVMLRPYAKISIYGKVDSLTLHEGAEAHIYGGNVHHLDVTGGKVYFYGHGSYCHKLTAVESDVYTRKANHIRKLLLNNSELRLSNDTTINEIMTCGAPSLIRSRVKGMTMHSFLESYNLDPDNVVIKQETRR